MNRGQDPESEASKEDYALQVIDLYMQDVHDVEENGGLRLAGIATPHPTGRVRFFVEGHRSRRRRETGVSLPTTRASARSGSIGRISTSSPPARVGLCAMIATASSRLAASKCPAPPSTSLLPPHGPPATPT